ncbi:hypothetical protein CHS0354_017452 [Potamilus streckersoni]|uniref:Uncharacterized protein n=1 Tax=Potamilus streckersoni TaxID=2493646 RepID=A0AAE0VU59_9BIVA|nr:hypothetical protein CHS0354_017452 [Potamilus streckersoni]
MSIFKNIKGTLQSVQQDLSAGLGLFSSSKDKSAVRSSSHYLSAPSPRVNFEAGADLLNKYQNVWKELHKYCEENGKKAEDVDIQIGSLYIQYDRSLEVFSKLHEELANLPVMLQKLQEVTDTLAQVEEEYDKVEVALIRLQNVCEEEELQKAKISHDLQLKAYREKRFKELNKVKVQIAKEHVQKVQAFEKKHQTQLKERQVVFQEVFEHDIEQYKKHGKIERLPSTPESEKKLDLEDFVPDDNDGALEEFFEDDVGIAPESVGLGTTDLLKNQEKEDKREEDEIDEEEEKQKGLKQEGVDGAEEQKDLKNYKNEENTPVSSGDDQFKDSEDSNTNHIETESSQETMQTTDVKTETKMQ